MSETETEQDVPFEEPDPELEPDEQEQEEAAEEEEAPAEPEPEPESADWSEKEAAKRFGKVNASFETYKASIDRNLEEKALDLIGCPLCYATDHPGFVNKHDLGRVPDEVEANVKMFLGYARENEYPAAKGINVCDGCAGLGKVSTGSRVAEHMTITCPSCKGYGYTPPPGAAAILGAPNGSAEQAVAQALSEVETPDRDNWGEPRILPDGTLNGNYGKMPQFKQVHPVYGVTANLSAEELVSG